MKIGIDLGGSHIGIGLVDSTNKIVAKKEYNWSKEDKINFPQSIEYYCKKLIKEIIEENNIDKVEKIGIGYPHKHIVNGVIYIRDKEFNLAKILEKEFKVPVYLKNDVKCSALCEKNIGNLKEYDNCLFMTLGTGIGGAYFYKKELLVPNTYPGLEVGHMIIEIDGRECRCGKKDALKNMLL